MKIFLRIAGALVGIMFLVIGSLWLIYELNTEATFILTIGLLDALAMLMVGFMFCKYAYKG